VSEKTWLMKSLADASQRAEELPRWARDVNTSVAEFYSRPASPEAISDMNPEPDHPVGESAAHNATSPERARVLDAFAVLCNGKRPPAEMVEAWESTSDDERLQSWAAEHSALGWVDGIVVIETAFQLARKSAEGL